MTTMLLSTGAKAAAEEPTPRVEHGGRQRGDAVEEHLRHEETQEVGRELLLRGDGSRPCTFSVYSSTIQGASTMPMTVMRDEQTIATVKIALGGVVVVRLEVLHEQRDEGRGEHAAEQQLVDDVRASRSRSCRCRRASVTPSAYAMAAMRAKPVTRESVVPTATTALERITCESSLPPRLVRGAANRRASKPGASNCGDSNCGASSCGSSNFEVSGGS